MRKNTKKTNLKINDINKNTSKEISYTISKLKANEKKYTIILVIAFIFIFIICGYSFFRVEDEPIDKYGENHHSDITDIFSEMVYVKITEEDILSDQDGLKKEAIPINFYNKTDHNVNYKLIFKQDFLATKKCGCSSDNFLISNFRFSIDGKHISSFNNPEEMVISTGFIKSQAYDSIDVKIWINDKSKFKGHFHGYFKFEEIEEDLTN